MLALLATLYPAFVIFYWLFFASLVINSVYPSVLLNARSRWMQRDAVAYVDIGLVCQGPLAIRLAWPSPPVFN